MTLNEFKAWLDGFSTAMGETPTAQQWAAIKAKLATVSEPAAPQGILHRFPSGPRWEPSLGASAGEQMRPDPHRYA